MNISEKKINNKRIFNVQVINRSETKKINVSLESILSTLSSKYDLSDWSFAALESSKNITNSSNSGTYVFLKKTVDNNNNNVKIVNTNIEADSSTEETKEASLPYGLKKQTKTKRKRATRKKTIEE